MTKELDAQLVTLLHELYDIPEPSEQMQTLIGKVEKVLEVSGYKAPLIRTELIPGSTTRRRVSHVSGVKVTIGLYRLYWTTGGSSLAAIGMMGGGDWWVAPTNWQLPATPLGMDGGFSWEAVHRIERIEQELS